ncbi:hypothetical protein [Fluviicola sp.]|uniref:hypothetical protein n=1 Tax=Fluviicola sp. TaxID=1917219 RepID=UPI0031DD037B
MTLFTRIKTITGLFLLLGMVSCSTSEHKKNFEHLYPKYWEKYSDLQLRDSLYADTLLVGPDIDGGNSAADFYKEEIHKLLIDLRNDKYKTDRLYPMASFSEVVLTDKSSGENHLLTTKQISRLLVIVNDPLSFNWSESTFEPHFQLDFMKDGAVVSSLIIEDDKSVVKIRPELNGFRKMKFGTLKPRFRDELIDLFREIEV